MTIDELIYFTEEADKQFQRGFAVSEQEILGKRRACCMMCGHCPSALAEILKEIKGKKKKVKPTPKHRDKDG